MMGTHPVKLFEQAKKLDDTCVALLRQVQTLQNQVKRYQGAFGRMLQMVPAEKMGEFEKLWKAVHVSNGPTLEIKTAPPPPQPKPGEKKKEAPPKDPGEGESAKEAEANAALEDQGNEALANEQPEE